MNRRLYFVLPDVKISHEIRKDLILAGIKSKSIHFVADEDTSLEHLPKVPIYERSDLTKGLLVGMALGAFTGFILGLIALAVPTWWYTKPLPIAATLIICTLIGFAGGGFWTAVGATTIHNARLKRFEDHFAKHEILMIVFVPFYQASKVRQIVEDKCPGARFRTENAISKD